MTASPDMSPRRVVVALLVLAALIALHRWHTFAEPLERDLTTYAVIGHELLRGRALYADLWDHKPPGIHVAYAAAEMIVGYGRGAVYLLAVGAAIATLLGVFVAGSAGGRGAIVGLVAAVLWTVICGDVDLQANQPNTEVFLNALLVWTVAVLVCRGACPLGAWRALVAGVLLALASLFKPVAVLTAALLAVAHILSSASAERRRAIGEMALMALPGVVAWLGVGLYFLSLGHFVDFRDAVFTYNGAYAGSTLLNLLRGLQPKRLFPPAMFALLPLVVVCTLGLLVRVLAGATRIRGDGAVLLAWAIGSWLSIAITGRFFPHYFQLWLPVLAVAGAWLLRDMMTHVATDGPRSFRRATVALVVFLALPQLATLRLDRDDWSRRKYGELYVQSRDAGRALDAQLAPGETFYEWGSETGLYFASRRPPPSGVLYHLPLLDGPLREELAARVIADLERRPPSVVVVELRAAGQRDSPVFDWIERRYAPAAEPETLGERFELWRRTR